MKLAKPVLFFCTYVFPVIGFPVLSWLWWQRSNLSFTALVMGLPLVYGYLIPGIGTNYLKLWRFHGPGRVGHYFIHHGFIYAATLGLELYLGFFPAPQWEVGNVLGNLLRTACIVAFTGWAYDLTAVRVGVIEIFNGPWKRGASPEVIVSHALPLCYALLGASYAGVASWGYQVLVLQPSTAYDVGWLFLLGLGLMTLFSATPYLLLEPR